MPVTAVIIPRTNTIDENINIEAVFKAVECNTIANELLKIAHSYEIMRKCIAELRRCKTLGFIGLLFNTFPIDIHPQLGDMSP